MHTVLKATCLAALVSLGATAPGFAHAFLDHAVPAVGGTVSAAPGELTLSFSEGVELAFSHVELTSAEGAAIPVGKPSFGGDGQTTLHVKVARALKPGTYIVHWRVVSVDTHKTSGTYKFTVAP